MAKIVIEKAAKRLGPQLFLLSPRAKGLKPKQVLGKRHKVRNQRVGTKPLGGFWTSTAKGITSEWLEFCSNGLDHGDKAWVLDPLPGADVYFLENQKDVDYLKENFPYQGEEGGIDWESLAELVDAIHVSSKATFLRDLAGWDVESTVWVNAKLHLRQEVDIEHRCRIPPKAKVDQRSEWERGTPVKPGVKKRRKPWLRKTSLSMPISAALVSDAEWDLFNSRQAGLGDCYEAAGKYVMEEALFPGSKKGLTLVHAEIVGQGPIEGLGYGHAWVEDGNTVIDKSNGRHLRMPKGRYYELGGVQVHDNIYRYTAQEMRRKLMQYEHWGPWDLKTSSGL